VGLVPWDARVKLAPWIWGQDMDGEPYPADDPQVIADPDDLVPRYPYAEPSTVPGAQEAVEADYDALWAFVFEYWYLYFQEMFPTLTEAKLNTFATTYANSYIPTSVATWPLDKRRAQCVVNVFSSSIMCLSFAPRSAPSMYRFLPYHLPDARPDDLGTLESNIAAYMNSDTSAFPSVWPLSSAYAALRTHVTTTYAAVGHNTPASGLVAAYMLLSPEPPFGEGAAFDTPNVAKHIVLMTDAELNLYEEEAAEMCEVLKDDLGITIYTVGFRAGNDPGPSYDFLEGCATSPDHMYTPDTGEELIQAFGAIADDIAEVRLTR
jgi:hypothetical protein